MALKERITLRLVLVLSIWNLPMWLSLIQLIGGLKVLSPLLKTKGSADPAGLSLRYAFDYITLNLLGS